MSPRQWLALFFFYISYLLFGASIFYHIERDLEVHNYGIELQRRIDINELLVRYTDPKFHTEILQMVGDYCGKPVTNYTLDAYQAPLTWSFYHAFFFSFTVCSTVGYGNISPSSTTGRMFMIFYALIGIPMNGFLFAYLGEFFGKVFITAYERYKAYKMATNKNYMPHQLGLIAQIILYLIPGIVIFLFLPSLIFSYFEDWPYSVAIYYSFVTLSTIGFGDYVPTFAPHQEDQFGFMFYVYEVFIIFWFIFGLGYLVMIMSFIAKGLRSKHITRLEHQLAENIKATQSRIWNGVTKDVSYLRRILNEITLMRFKSTEDEEPDVCSTHRRTSSCPDLTIYRPSMEPYRKRAQSLFYHVDDDPEFLSNLKNRNRVQSDGDLSKFDGNRAFDESNLQLEPTELLARVFTALGNIKAADDEVQSLAAMSGVGFHGLSDSQILASEKQHDSNWSLQLSDSSFSAPPPKARGRAASDFRAPQPDQLEIANDSHDWTWNGSNQQIDEFMRLRKLNKKKSPDLYRAALTSPKVDVPNPLANMEEGISGQTGGRASSPSIFDRINPFKSRDYSRKMSLTPDRSDIKNYLDSTSAGRNSRMSITPFSNATPARRRRTSTYSMVSTTDGGSADVLENTTIADLIRALEVMHTQAVTGDGTTLDSLSERPRPRLGSSTSMAISSTTHDTHQQQFKNGPPLINVFPPSTPVQRRDRRNSMRPLSTSNTPLSYRSNRRQSTIVDLPSTRRSSLLVPPSLGPPPYSESTPRTTHRRFSVRPTMLSIPPGQSPLPSIQATSTLQRRLSRPGHLTSDYNTFNRFGRSISAGSSSHSASPMETSPVVNRNTILTTLTENRLNNPQEDRIRSESN